MQNVSLSLEQYEALIAFAREGQTPEMLRSVNAFLQDIEQQNGIRRSYLHVQWQETNSALPPTARFPDRWPPELRCTIERTDRPVSRADVDAVMATRARRPLNILVTADPSQIISGGDREQG
jgi:hypothetical protein